MWKKRRIFFFLVAICVFFSILVSSWFLVQIPQVHTPRAKSCVDLVPQLRCVRGSLISWTLKSNTSKLTPIVVSFFIRTLSLDIHFWLCATADRKNALERFNSNLMQANDVSEHRYFDKGLDTAAWMETTWRKVCGIFIPQTQSPGDWASSKTYFASPNPILAP